MLRFNICQTYSTVTPESCAIGDFEDNGFEIDPANDWRLADIIHEIKRQGVEYCQANPNSLQFSSGFHCIDYRTAEDKEKTFFIYNLKPHQVNRLEKVIKKVLNIS